MAEQVQPGFYTLTVVATNTGYMTETITRSLIVREAATSSTSATWTRPTTAGHRVSRCRWMSSTSAAAISTRRQPSLGQSSTTTRAGKQVEPSQAGTYKAKVTLPASAYWTEKVEKFTFTIRTA